LGKDFTLADEPRTPAEKKKFVDSVLNNLNKLSDTYWFEADENGNMSYKVLKGIEETKPLSVELLKRNLIERTIDPAKGGQLEFYFDRENDGWTLNFYDKDSKNVKSSLIALGLDSAFKANPVIPKEDIAYGNIIETKNVSLENGENHILLGHELVHALNNYDEKYIKPLQERDPYVGEFVAANEKIQSLIERRNLLLNNENINLTTEDNGAIDRAKEKYALEGETELPYNHLNLDSDRKLLLAYYEDEIKAILVRAEKGMKNDFYFYQHYDPATKTILTVPTYRDEIITTVGDTIKFEDFNGNTVDMSNQRFSENALRDEHGLDFRMNYMANQKNIQAYTNMYILAKNREAFEQALDKGRRINASNLK
jgi:hypothetical protein